MTKIVKIRLENFKAIELKEMDFRGCSAIITGGNNKGKTSFLRGIPDRVRFLRPQIKVRQGATEGYGEMTLDSGERLIWEFDDAGHDKLTFISQEGTKANVTKELGAKLFPPLFDIDKFLQSTPKEQTKQLQKLVGLDFTDVDKRRDEAYKYRYLKNEESERYRVKLSQLMKCDPVTPVDLELLNIKRREAKAAQDKERARLNEVYLANKKVNKDLRDAWDIEKSKVDEEVTNHNTDQFKNEVDYNNATLAADVLYRLGLDGMDKTVVEVFVDGLKKKIKPTMKAASYYPKEPTYIEEMPYREDLDKIEKSIEAIDAEILAATQVNVRAKEYQDYLAYIKEVEAAKEAAAQADQSYQVILDEIKGMIATAKFPEGISISSETNEITVDGFPIDRSQLSTSKLYTAALRIASMNLGEVKTLYFDASFLDNNSLRDIYQWAEAHDLQLLIERPDLDGGDIEYQLIEG